MIILYHIAINRFPLICSQNLIIESSLRNQEIEGSKFGWVLGRLSVMGLGWDIYPTALCLSITILRKTKFEKMIFFLLTSFQFSYYIYIYFHHQQPQPVITMNGSVRIKSCDLQLPQLQVMTQSTSSQHNNNNSSNNNNNNSNSDNETGRAVDNQYSFV